MQLFATVDILDGPGAPRSTSPIRCGLKRPTSGDGIDFDMWCRAVLDWRRIRSPGLACLVLVIILSMASGVAVAASRAERLQALGDQIRAHEGRLSSADIEAAGAAAMDAPR
ncbi:hypothetical protein CSW62_09665 [Caulobacter sp. FWC2]|nr:hypothetical protein CSW62_09665 [Caulobacter sp. FWC2]